jgi:hypothetical protein
MEGVDIFTTGGGGVVPEPGSAALVLLGLVGMLSFGVRQRRTKTLA